MLTYSPVFLSYALKTSLNFPRPTEAMSSYLSRELKGSLQKKAFTRIQNYSGHNHSNLQAEMLQHLHIRVPHS